MNLGERKQASNNHVLPGVKTVMTNNPSLSSMRAGTTRTQQARDAAGYDRQRSAVDHGGDSPLWRVAVLGDRITT